MHCQIPPRHHPVKLPPLGLWGCIILFSLCICAFLAAGAEERQEGGICVVLRDSDTGTPNLVKPRPRCASPGKIPTAQLFQKVEEKGGLLSASYGFVNFNNDPLHVTFSFPLEEFSSYKLGYGYTEPELDALKQWQTKALDEALHSAQKNRYRQEQLNKMCEQINAEYKARHKAFLGSRGFTLLPRNILMADIPGIVKRNVRHLRPIALSLNGSAAKKGYEADEIISAALSLVQTAIIYEAVPMVIKGRQTGGLLPPVETMVKGKGDCDTKTALLASILLNWDRMNLVGVTVPGHYLMGILHNPAKGDAFIEYNGLRYILIEPAGPAWLPPGTIVARTAEKLSARDGLKIEPLVAN